MARRSQSFLTKGIKKLIVLVPMLYYFATDFFVLVGEEACLVGKSLVMIVMLSMLAASLLILSWIGLLTMFGLYLISLGMHYQLVLGLLVLLNLLLFLITFLTIKKMKKNLFFPETLRQLGLRR